MFQEIDFLNLVLSTCDKKTLERGHLDQISTTFLHVTSSHYCQQQQQCSEVQQTNILKKSTISERSGTILYAREFVHKCICLRV